MNNFSLKFSIIYSKRNILKKELFAAIGKEFTDDVFFNICFQIGFELEIGDAEEMQM